MDKRTLIENITERLKAADLRKPVAAQKSTITISDDSGNSKKFVVRRPSTGLLYSRKDVGRVLQACCDVIVDTLAKGESISITNFGVLSTHYRAARSAKHPVTGQPVIIKERYIPKFSPGSNLRRAAMIYEQSFADPEAVVHDGN